MNHLKMANFNFILLKFNYKFVYNICPLVKHKFVFTILVSHIFVYKYSTSCNM
jgi:hypothetical protein